MQEQRQRKRRRETTTRIPIIVATQNEHSASSTRTTTPAAAAAAAAAVTAQPAAQLDVPIILSQSAPAAPTAQEPTHTLANNTVDVVTTVTAANEGTIANQALSQSTSLIEQQHQQQPQQLPLKRRPDERVVEWERIRLRWKSRIYNLRNETNDIGNAIYNNIQLKQRQQQQQQQQQEKEQQNNVCRKSKKRKSFQVDEEKDQSAGIDAMSQGEVLADSIHSILPIQQEQRQPPNDDSDEYDDDESNDDENGQKNIYQQLLQSSQRENDDQQRQLLQSNAQQQPPPQPQMTYSQIMEPWEYGTKPPGYPLLFHLQTNDPEQQKDDDPPFVDEYKKNKRKDVNDDDDDEVVFRIQALMEGQLDQSTKIMHHVYYVSNALSDFSLYHYESSVLRSSVEQILPKYHVNPRRAPTAITSSIAMGLSSFPTFIQRRNIYRTLTQYLLLVTPNTSTIPQQQNVIQTLYKMIQYNDLFMKVPERHQQLSNNNGDDDESNSTESNPLNREEKEVFNGVIHTSLYATKAIFYDHVCQQNGINYMAFHLIQDNIVSLYDLANSNNTGGRSEMNSLLKTIAQELLNIRFTGSVPRGSQRVFESKIVGRRMNPILSLLPHQIRNTLRNYFQKTISDQRIEVWTQSLCSSIDPLKTPKRDSGRNNHVSADFNPNKSNHRCMDPVDTTMMLITPITDYVPISGTSPPIPLFPLDRTNIIYGVTDKFEQVIHTGHIIDESIYKVTIASLINQLAGLRSKRSTTNHTVSLLIQKQLASILKRIVRVNQSGFQKWISNLLSLPKVEIPMAYYYRAILEYCSIVMSGIIPLSVHITDEGNSSRNDSQSATPMVPTIEYLYEFLESRIDHNGLQMFTSLHALFGVLRICKVLPEAGIELMLRLQYNDTTPVNKLKHLLEYLEESKCLTQQSLNNNFTTANNGPIATVHVGELEYALYRASTIFHTNCIQRDPRNIQYHCWYIATLASSLILCSGQKISKTSSPSKSTRDVYRITRRPLPKFQELRKQTATAFRSLLHLCVRYPSCVGNRAILSLLEWNQVMSLLLGPIETSGITESYDMYVDHFRNLHCFHEQQFANLKFSSKIYKSITAQLDGSENQIDNLATKDGSLNYDVRNKRLHELASKLECNPSDIENWRSFIYVLTTSTASVGTGQPISTTINWWGKDRVDWWHKCLLHTYKPKEPEVTTRKFSPKRKMETPDVPDKHRISECKTEVIHYLKELEKRTEHQYEFSDAYNKSYFQSPMEVDDVDHNEPHKGLQWLDTFIASYIDESIDRTLMNNSTVIGTSRSRYPVHCLFHSNNNPIVMDHDQDTNHKVKSLSDVLEDIPKVNDVDNRNYIKPAACAIEFIGYKIVLLYHLSQYNKNTDHDPSTGLYNHHIRQQQMTVTIQNHIHHLLILYYRYMQQKKQLADDTNITDADSNNMDNNPVLQTFVWLYRDMGIDIIEMML